MSECIAPLLYHTYKLLKLMFGRKLLHRFTTEPYASESLMEASLCDSHVSFNSLPGRNWWDFESVCPHTASHEGTPRHGKGKGK